MLAELQELETHLRSTFGAWHHYLLRVWQQCRSIEAAGIEDRIKIAKAVLADVDRGGWAWAVGGWHMLLAEIQAKLHDLDPHVRQDAAIALGDLGLHARAAIPVLLDRLRSPEETLHDRTCAAWALPRLGVDGHQAVPIYLQVLSETADQVHASELRYRAAEAVESLTESFRILVPLARRCLLDRGWKPRLYGLTLSERLGKRHRRLLDMLLPGVEALIEDEMEEVRELARVLVQELRIA